MQMLQKLCKYLFINSEEKTLETMPSFTYEFDRRINSTTWSSGCFISFLAFLNLLSRWLLVKMCQKGTAIRDFCQIGWIFPPRGPSYRVVLPCLVLHSIYSDRLLTFYAYYCHFIHCYYSCSSVFIMAVLNRAVFRPPFARCLKYYFL